MCPYFTKQTSENCVERNVKIHVFDPCFIKILADWRKFYEQEQILFCVRKRLMAIFLLPGYFRVRLDTAKTDY